MSVHEVFSHRRIENETPNSVGRFTANSIIALTVRDTSHAVTDYSQNGGIHTVRLEVEHDVIVDVRFQIEPKVVLNCVNYRVIYVVSSEHSAATV